MNIYIMSHARAGSVKTLDNLPKELLPRTFLVVRPSELRDYVSRYPQVTTIPTDGWVSNYSDKFQWILHDGMADGYDKCIIMDDDLRFATEEDGKFLAVRTDHQRIKLAAAILSMEQHLDSVPLVSLHPRQMANHAPPNFKENGKVVCIQAVNRKVIGKLKVNQWPVLADVILNAYVLGMGWGNRLLTDAVVDWGECNAQGGCSETRTAQVQKEAVLSIVDKYYPYIKLSRKQPKGNNWLADDDGFRWDFRGQWKRLCDEAPWQNKAYDDRFLKLPIFSEDFDWSRYT